MSIQLIEVGHLAMASVAVVNDTLEYISLTDSFLD